MGNRETPLHCETHFLWTSPTPLTPGPQSQRGACYRLWLRFLRVASGRFLRAEAPLRAPHRAVDCSPWLLHSQTFCRAAWASWAGRRPLGEPRGAAAFSSSEAGL